MKLLIVFNSLDIGGIENRIIDITHQLSLKFPKLKLTLCLKSAAGPLISRLSPQVALLSPLNPHPLLFPFWLAFQIHHLRPHTTLAFGNYSAICAVLGKILSLSRTDIVISEDSSIQLQIQQDTFSRLRLFLVKITYPFAKAIIVLSSAGYQNLSKIIPKYRHIIISPIWLSHLFAYPRRPPLTRPYDLLFLGRFVLQKNPLRFVKIISLLKITHPKIKCLMVGYGPLLININSKIKKLKLADNITLLPATIDPSPYYRQSKLFLLTSRHEGFPVVLLEAAASYCLPLSPPLPEIAPYFQQYSHRLIFHSHSDAVRQILFLLNHPRLRHQISDYYHRLVLTQQSTNSDNFIKLILK